MEPNSKGKSSPEEVDEMLAALGIKVRSLEMADVTQKLEQLEMAMGGASTVNDDASILEHLALDTIHYNPSDLSTWLDSMLSELNAPPPIPATAYQQQNNRQTNSLHLSCDLKPIPSPMIS